MKAPADDLDLDRILRLCNIIRCYETLVEDLLQAEHHRYVSGMDFKEAVADYKMYLLDEAKQEAGSLEGAARLLGLSPRYGTCVTRICRLSRRQLHRLAPTGT